MIIFVIIIIIIIINSGLRTGDCRILLVPSVAVHIQGGPKTSKPLPNVQKIVFNHIKTCKCD